MNFQPKGSASLDRIYELPELPDEEDDDDAQGEVHPLMSKNNAQKISQKTDTDLDYSQWQVGPNGKFRSAAKTIPNLHPGVYKIEADDAGPYLQLQTVISDNIVALPETANSRVLDQMKVFWNSQSKYEKFGLIYKRGIMLYGPPGSGKSVTINLLMKELISLNGIVLLCSNPDLLAHMLQRVRHMETERPIIVVLEDIDEIIQKYGEHTILSMLDGENQIANVVYIATTNYPDKLGARIVNRPSRFDECILVDMPSSSARKAYLRHATTVRIAGEPDQIGLDDATLDKWTADTDGFSIAHLRELVAASFCLEQPYNKVIKRLRKMLQPPKFQDGYKKSSGGGFMGDDEE